MTRTLDDLPGPPRLPLLGNLHQVRQATLHATAEEWCERYGPIFRVGLGPRPVVVIDDLDEINRILRERPDVCASRGRCDLHALGPASGLMHRGRSRRR
jgi:hypothetical protein